MPLVHHTIDRYGGESIENGDETYFDKLRSVALTRPISDKMKENMTISTSNAPVNVLDNLMEFIRSPPPTSYSSTTEKDRSLKKISFNYGMSRSLQRENPIRHAPQYHVNHSFSINTRDGNIHFDFSNQSIDYKIYLHLMQLVRSSNLDQLITKLFHKSGEYHHVDYKENRRHQIASDEENHQCSSRNIHRPLISLDSNKTNCYLTVAKAVHFRGATNCFVLDGIDISSRFQYDRKVMEDACRRFLLAASTNMKYQILVLCSHWMKEVYRLFELLFKSLISPNISIIYLTFDQIKPCLTEEESSLDETPLKDEMINEKSMTDSSEENSPSDIHLSDESNEQYLLNCFRTSSLILILMKHFDQFYFTKLIQWYTDGTSDCDLSVSANWNGMFEHWWLITGDYQHAETVFNIPRSNLFLWPTDHHDLDYTSMVISSILALPIALTINYQNYSSIIHGMSIIDQHCRETTIEENVCVRMALLRVWSRIRGRKPPTIVTCDDDNLQYFKEYVDILLSEYEDSIAQKLTKQSPGDEDRLFYDILQICRATLRSDLNGKQQSSFTTHTEIDQTLRSQSLITLDQLTPLTLGALMDIYQKSLFFEYIICQNCDIASNDHSFHSDK